jgi:hypothetical protein
MPGFGISNSGVLCVGRSLFHQSASLALGLIASSASLAAIPGTVFRDFNDNGVLNSTVAVGTAVDTHLAGVTVTAYNSAGAVAATTTTVRCTAASAAKESDGTAAIAARAAVCTGADTGPNYSLPVTTGGPYRIEFSGLATGFRSSAKSGASNATSVQFVTLVLGIASANAGFYLPSEFCQSNPDIATTCYAINDPLSGDATQAAEKVIVSFPYSRPTTTGSTVPPTNTVNVPEVGSVWAVAYARNSRSLFTAAALKRHSGLGPNGIGGIYMSTLPISDGNTIPYVDLNALVPVHDPVVGNPLNVLSNGARGLGAATNAISADPSTFFQIGRVGVGDIDISEDERTLWWTNLYDQKLYGVKLPRTPASTDTFGSADLVTPSQPPWLAANPCTNGVARPWATKSRGNLVYVGLVCTGESNPLVPSDNAATRAAKRAALSALVYSYDVATDTWTQIVVIPLNYPRDAAYTGVGSTDPIRRYDNFFNPWIGLFNAAVHTDAILPQAILSDIEIDVDGSLILSFLDRWGNQTSPYNAFPATPSPTGPQGSLEYPIVGGEILRLCRIPSATAAVTYELESNGKCRLASADGFTNSTTFTAGANLGPGGHEYYLGDNAQGADHQETSTGGLALLPGTKEVVASVMDPITADSGGVKVLSNETGRQLRTYQLYQSSTPTPSVLGKGNGIGDLELMCNAAPIELGNRVWLDSNGNGVQDPGEAPIGGVTVRLYAPDGSGPDGMLGTADDVAGAGPVIGTAVTDSNGEYYFSSATGTTTANAVYNIAQLKPNTSGFKIVLDNAADYLDASKLQNLPLTSANSATSGGLTDNDPLADVRDSDATLPTPSNPIGAGNYPTITVNTGNAGENNHGLDFGFVPTTYSLGNRVWFDADNSGGVTGTELGVDGVVIELLTETSPGVFAASGTTLTTANGGYYRFDGLAAGNYQVRVAASNFGPTGALRGYFTSGTPTANANGDANNDNNGIAPAGGNYVGLGVTSGTVMLGGATPEPTTDNTEAGTVGTNTYNATNSNGTVAPDGQANLSVDFGFHKVSLGNRLWLDDGAGTPANANNGIPDSGEAAVADGTVVNLVDSTGTLIATTTTTGGLYMFMTDTNGNPLLLSGSPTDIAKQFRVVVPTPPVGTVSSTPTETALTAAGDNKDHGAPGTGTAVQTHLFSLTPGATTNAQTVTNAIAVTNQPQLDLGFAPTPAVTYSIGNRVFLDSNDNGAK